MIFVCVKRFLWSENLYLILLSKSGNSALFLMQKSGGDQISRSSQGKNLAVNPGHVILWLGAS